MEKLAEEKILGVKVNTGLTMARVLDIIERNFLTDGNLHYISTTNPEYIMDCQKDSEFMDIVNNCDLSVPDGSGILYALEYNKRVSKYKKSLFYPVKAFFEGLKVGFEGFVNSRILGEQITGVELTEELCKLSAEKGHSVYFLGGRPKNLFNKVKILPGDVKDMATLAADEMRRKYPNVHIIGSNSSFSSEEKDDQASVAAIRDCMQKHAINKLDILIVAYNHPYHSKWILRNAKNIPASLSIGVGGTLDYLSKYKNTEPAAAAKRNLRWLIRLFAQPGRFKRIFNAFPLFPLLVFYHSLKNVSKNL